jgi:glycosyltransferase involved in cell wall biosynthesis
MRPLISVVVCTRNRADQLRQLLDSLTRLTIPQELSWDVLVIDNGSTDHTAAVVTGFAGRLDLRREVEPEPGIAAARNRGATLARGKYIVWTDDDCEAHPNWLAAYAGAFARHPEAALFAGRIVPILAPPPAPWFQKHLAMLAWVVAARDFGDAELALSIELDHLPFSANAAVRAEEQARFPYDTSLGLKGAARMVGEEVTSYRAMLAAGAQGRWVPDAKIFHHIPQARQTIAYVKSYFAGHGAFDAQRKIASGTHSPARVLLIYLPRMLFNFIAFQLARRVLPSRIWLRRLINFGTAGGAVAHVIGLTTRGADPPGHGKWSRGCGIPAKIKFDSNDRNA